MRPVVGWLVAAGLLLSSVACTNDTERFCERLGATYSLTGLRDALDRNDMKTVERSLRELSDLADDAPKEIRDDFRKVVDTIVATVRAVTPVTGPNGETMPIDLLRLDDELSNVSESSQHIVDYADRVCGLSL